ncbi:DNA-binding IclR family transcriptional regulator [Bradyrhizobium sp. AZCC 1678]|uniref:IclR family transcriptional regulator n=1 Tax=Bradyrhizobium sp. AZCC 1678 TaxID=3117030 RepID=UPI002FEFED0A
MTTGDALMGTETSVRGDTPGTVQRVLHVIQYFARHRESSLKEMSDALELPPSTCHRLLEIMRREGFIDTVPGQRKYRLGIELLRVCAEIQSNHDLTDIAMPFLEKIADESGETAVFSLYLPSAKKICYALKVDSRAALRYDIRLNVPISLLWGASGLSIAAFLPRQDIDLAYADEGPSPVNGVSLPSRDELELRLDQIRQAGYAITFGEKMAGAIGIAAPVFGRSDMVFGSLLVVYPSLRVSDEEREPLARLVREAAAGMSNVVGAQAVGTASRTELPRVF